MHKRVAGSSVVLGVTTLILVGLSALAACGKDDDDRAERPEPVPAVADAGFGDAGDQAECPSLPPRIGETCRRSADITEQTCRYELGTTCTEAGVVYDWVDDYRCFDGTWHLWNTDSNRCRR